jgi:hypothetical protein
LSCRPSAWDDVQIEYINKMIAEYGIKRLFETGTFHGQTALYFRVMRGLDVYTVENAPSYHDVAFENLNGSGVMQMFGDSRTVLKNYISTGNSGDTLYYLDAHLGSNCPLKGELEILDATDKFVAVCHDVLVPNMPHFGGEHGVTDIFNQFQFTKPTTVLYPNYVTQMHYHPHKLIGMAIVIRGYPIISDARFIECSV